jgi:antitoxin CcdA
MERALKTPTNVTLRSDLLREARALKLNLSALLETAVEDAIRQRRRKDWLAENSDAIDGYNQRVSKRGVFGDRYRRF